MGWGWIEAFLEGAKFVGVEGLDALVDYSVSSPSAMWLVLAGVRFSGIRAGVGGLSAQQAGDGGPHEIPGVRRDDVWIQISPAYMPLPFDETKRTRQKMAHTLMTVPARSRAV